MLYRLFACLIRVATSQFFRKILVVGSEPVGNFPIIVASNHPNLAVDPFLIGTVFRRPLFFLAKSTLFRNPALGALFRALHMIPVYRKQDQSNTAKNDEMFRDAMRVLHDGKSIVIFPEGTSTEDRRLLPLKTGAARLALMTVDSKPDSKLMIQPVGITYLAPRVFQSSVTITLGRPIDAGSYLQAYRTDARAAVDDLTGALEAALESVTVSIENPAHQQLVEKIAFLFGTEGDIRERMEQIARHVERLAPHHPDRREALEAKLDFYCSMRNAFPAVDSTGRSKLGMVAAAPILFAGALVNIVPYRIVGILARRAASNPHDLASVKICVGFLVYSAWYVVLASSVICFGFPWHAAAAVFGLLVMLGFFTNRYLEVYWSALVSLAGLGPSPGAALDEYERSLRSELLKLSDESIRS